jgi:hypothetical protein
MPRALVLVKETISIMQGINLLAFLQAVYARDLRSFAIYPYFKLMSQELFVRQTLLYYKACRFVLLTSVFITGTYYFFYLDVFVWFVTIGLALFIIPWSFMSAMKESYKNKSQFQILKVKDDHFHFENLPLQGGSRLYAKIDFRNIKTISIKRRSVEVLFVRRYKWIGEPCDYIEPVGYVPKLQVFALPFQNKKKREIIAVLKATRIEITGRL